MIFKTSYYKPAELLRAVTSMCFFSMNNFYLISFVFLYFTPASGVINQQFNPVSFEEKLATLNLEALTQKASKDLKNSILNSDFDSYEKKFSWMFKKSSEISSCIDTSKTSSHDAHRERLLEILGDYENFEKYKDEVKQIEKYLEENPVPIITQNFIVDESCLNTALDNLVKDWTPKDLLPSSKDNGHDEEQTTIDSKIYIQFRKEIYDHFKEAHNYTLLDQIFKNVVADYKKFFQNNSNIHHGKTLLDTILDEISLEKTFRSFLQTPTGSCLSAGIEQRSVNFCPSHFYDGGLSPMMAYSILAHEIAHYFDPCPQYGALVPMIDSEVLLFESYFYQNVLWNLKDKYATENKNGPLSSFNGNFEDWMCGDQLRELTPDWFSAQLLKENAQRYGYDLNLFEQDWRAFRSIYDKDSAEDDSFNIHPKSETRLDMILNVILNKQRY